MVGQNNSLDFNSLRDEDLVRASAGRVHKNSPQKLLEKFSAKNFLAQCSSILQIPFSSLLRVPIYPNTIGTKAMATHRNTENNSFLGEGYLTKKGVRTFLGGPSPISATTLQSWVNERGFPKPIYLTHKTPVWVKAEVVAWVEAKRNVPSLEENA